MNKVSAIHQIIGLCNTGNAVADHAMALQDALRGWGFESWIYASDIAPNLQARAKPLHTYRPRQDKKELLILHYSAANKGTHLVKHIDVPLILDYHNVTPPGFLAGVGSAITQSVRRGRKELALFKERACLALADSTYNQQELIAAGFEKTAVLPILMPLTLQKTEPDPAIKPQNKTNFLFVGRLMPNKRCEDVIKLLYCYRQINPDVHLYLVGADHLAPRYVKWLHQFIDHLDLADAVTVTGHVSHAALAAYYRTADLFITMSEHEGFCIPLIESMRFDLPVVAYASSAIPETLGGAGVLLHKKEYPIMSELMHEILTDAQLRQKIIIQQQQRMKFFEPEIVLNQFHQFIQETIKSL
ncbi:MAG: glycosyltransferase [Chloroflexi bacterium]|nr:glycosyltransferase [Chloroflexota bacterium]